MAEENKVNDQTLEELNPVKMMTIIIQGIVQVSNLSAEITRKVSELERKISTLCAIAKVDENSIKAALDELFAEEEAEEKKESN